MGERWTFLAIHITSISNSAIYRYYYIYVAKPTKHFYNREFIFANMAESSASATCCSETHAKYETNRKEWLISPGCKKLEVDMRKIAKDMRQVNFIVCCNVGPLKSEVAYMQYAAVVQMRKILEEVQQKGKVSIVARALAPYPDELCAECDKTLASEPFNFESSSKNADVSIGVASMLIAPNQETFVARNLVNNLEHVYPDTLYGPAALLCPPITTNGNMSVNAPDIQIEDASSPKLLKWAKKCEDEGRYFDSQIEPMSRSMRIYWSRPIPGSEGQ
jgi:hypothetical protein